MQDFFHSPPSPMSSDQGVWWILDESSSSGQVRDKSALATIRESTVNDPIETARLRMIR